MRQWFRSLTPTGRFLNACDNFSCKTDVRIMNSDIIDIEEKEMRIVFYRHEYRHNKKCLGRIEAAYADALTAYEALK